MKGIDKRVAREIFGTYINLVGDIKVSYRLQDWGDPHSGNVNVWFLKETSVPPTFFELGIGDDFSNYRDNQLGEANYAGSKLLSVVLGRSFSIEGAENYLRSPLMIIGQSSRNKDWEVKNFSRLLNDDFFMPDKTITGRQAVISNERGESIFRVECEMQKFGQEGGNADLLSVFQTHIPTGIIKTLKAPLALNAQRVSRAVFSTPPYPKEEMGRLVVPWRNIHRLVGASLSYSYSPQNPKST